MIKLFSARSLAELEEDVNQFEQANVGTYFFEEHSVTYANGIYIISVKLDKKDFN